MSALWFKIEESMLTPTGLARTPKTHVTERGVLDDSIMRRSDALREMMRFARALIEDGDVSDSEAKGFYAWIQANPDVIGLPQVDQLLGILANFFADGRLSEAERKSLTEILENFGG